MTVPESLPPKDGSHPVGVYQVTVEAVFPASHQLRLYDGSLEPLHVHQWRVQASLAGATLDAMGVLIDFVRVERVLDDVLAGFRDRHLNDLPCFQGGNPSTENLARCLFESLRDRLEAPELLQKVTVWETSRFAAAYAG